MNAAWSAWIGRSETAGDLLTPAMVEALAATLDGAADLAPDAPVPQGVHWLLAPPRAPMSALGRDGHSGLGAFLPPIDLPRRMWAASAVRFTAPLRIGDTVERVSTIASIEAKEGASGPLVFVGIDRVYRVAGAVRVEERQTLVFRDLQPYAPPAAAAEDAAPAAFERRLTPDPVMLFRYSAITFNGHRIHYDRPYATEVELYPGLVIHGPLMATLCLDLAARELGPNRLAAFSFRGVSAAFAGAALRVAATRDGDDLAFTVTTEGRVTMTARARIG